MRRHHAIVAIADVIHRTARAMRWYTRARACYEAVHGAGGSVSGSRRTEMMKKRAGIKKVVLAKQTIRELSSRELTTLPVVGGRPREWETAASNQDVCCA
jgi:hypothetical protein